MKLHATLETSTGKVVSISDNEQIIATVYDRNLKAYSVIIEWCIVGDPEHGICQDCGEFTDDLEDCDKCGKNNIKVVPAIMGAIVTSKEWRNEPKDRRRAQRTA